MDSSNNSLSSRRNESSETWGKGTCNHPSCLVFFHHSLVNLIILSSIIHCLMSQGDKKRNGSKVQKRKEFLGEPFRLFPLQNDMFCRHEKTEELLWPSIIRCLNISKHHFFFTSVCVSIVPFLLFCNIFSPSNSLHEDVVILTTLDEQWYIFVLYRKKTMSRNLMLLTISLSLFSLSLSLIIFLHPSLVHSTPQTWHTTSIVVIEFYVKLFLSFPINGSSSSFLFYPRILFPDIISLSFLCSSFLFIPVDPKTRSGRILEGEEKKNHPGWSSNKNNDSENDDRGRNGWNMKMIGSEIGRNMKGRREKYEKERREKDWKN